MMDEKLAVYGTSDLEPPKWLFGPWFKLMCQSRQLVGVMYLLLTNLLTEKKGLRSEYQALIGVSATETLGTNLCADATPDDISNFLAAMEKTYPILVIFDEVVFALLNADSLYQEPYINTLLENENNNMD